MSRDELGRVLDTGAAHSPRSSALVHLLAFNGLRVAGALNADVDDLIHDRGHRALRITRKGGKAGRVAVAPVTSRALDTYLADRTTGPIFLNRDNTNRLSYTSAYEQLRRLTKTAGVPGRREHPPPQLPPHLRHRSPRRRRRPPRRPRRPRPRRPPHHPPLRPLPQPPRQDPTYALAAAIGRL